MDTTPETNGEAGAAAATTADTPAAAVAAPAAAPAGVDPFADEHGRLRGVVLWYNTTGKFGFIVPENPSGPVVRVLKKDIKGDNDSDDVKALQVNQLVHFTPGADGVSATEVTDTEEGSVDFSKKLDAREAEIQARELLMPHSTEQYYANYAAHPPPGAPPGAGLMPPQPKPKGQLPVDEEKIVYGTVTGWNAREGWGHIKPDVPGQPKEEAGEEKEPEKDAEGDVAMNGADGEEKPAAGDGAEKEGAEESTTPSKKKGKKKNKMPLIVAEIDQIETAPDRFPGLTQGLRVQFRVANGPYPNTVTAIKVRNEDGSEIVYESSFMKKHKKREPIDETVYKGTVAFFHPPRHKPWGFIKPEGKPEKEHRVFCHIVETNFMPLKEGTDVEYKLAAPEKETQSKKACCVTGPDGAALEYVRPQKRRRVMRPPPRPQPPVHYPPPGPGFVPPYGFAYGYPPPGAPGPHMGFAPPGWGPMGYFGAPDGNAYAEGGYVHQSPGARRGGGPNKKRKKAGTSTSSPAVPEEERTCQVCSKTMTGKKPYETHMAGKAHQKKVKQMAMGAAA